MGDRQCAARAKVAVLFVVATPTSGMKRRAVLGGLATGLAALSGCVVGRRGGVEADGAAPGVGSHTPGEDGDLPLPESAFERGAARDAIAAITDPVYAEDWSGLSIELGDGTYEPRLAPTDLVVAVDGVQRAPPQAYPLKVLTWHEAVNADELLVTYCPLCRSAVVAERTVAGRRRTFGVSGLLLNENLVLYDRESESLWSQIRAQAVRGPLTGTDLTLVPSRLTQWSDWRAGTPDGEVLVPPPHSDTVVGEVRANYDFDLYGRQQEVADEIESVVGDDYGDTRLPKRAIVLGIANAGEAVAYPWQEVAADGVVNDRVGGLPVVVVPRGKELLAFDRRVGGRAREFGKDGDHLLAGDSRFDATTGEGVSGPLGGDALEAVPATTMYWFAWLEFHPETEVYGREG